MDIDLPKGNYVLAVSGGVDSMVLLDLLAKPDGCQLIVAHFDHGIRPDSILDRELVQQTAAQYDIPFVYETAKLGPSVSEETARNARYEFLRRTMKAHGATAIITAHHQDDAVETAVINMLRGTGRRGLSSLKNTADVMRPLLQKTKQELMDYAQQRGLQWREDSTNQDQTYLRNYVRHNLLNKLTAEQRTKLLNHVLNTQTLNTEIDQLLADQLHIQPTEIDRHWFIMLPHSVARDFLAEWLRMCGIRQFDRKLIERLVHAAKTYAPGKRVDITGDHQLGIKKHQLALLTTIPRHESPTSV